MCAESLRSVSKQDLYTIRETLTQKLISCEVNAVNTDTFNEVDEFLN